MPSAIHRIHHYSMNAPIEKKEEIIHFYRDLLHIPLKAEWPEDGSEGMLFGDEGSLVEIFFREDWSRDRGAIRHIALQAADPDLIAETAMLEGVPVPVPPKSIEQPIRARIAFLEGPLGEQIELICEEGSEAAFISGELELFGTLGPSCHSADLLADMMAAGMNGIRLNISHGSLDLHQDWIDALHEAEERTGKSVSFLMDLKGREMRLSDFTPFITEAGQTLMLGDDVPAASAILDAIEPGDLVRINDGKIVLRALAREDGHWVCEVLQGGKIEPHKSLKIDGKTARLSAISPVDLHNLDLAAKAGVTSLMIPFVQTREDLEMIRTVLQEKGLKLKIYAKIENEAGLQNLESFMDLADVIVIARGDLGQDIGLVRLPAVQLEIEEKCRKAGKPFLVVTELLASMNESPVCTRAEANDIYRSVLDGASALMLTNETAAGKYPLEAMKTLAAIAKEAEKGKNASGF